MNANNVDGSIFEALQGPHFPWLGNLSTPFLGISIQIVSTWLVPVSKDIDIKYVQCTMYSAKAARAPAGLAC